MLRHETERDRDKERKEMDGRKVSPKTGIERNRQGDREMPGEIRETDKERIKEERKEINRVVR